MSAGPAPTFNSKWDRFTYLLAEFKLLVFGLLLGAIALFAYYQPTLPTPPAWVGAVIVGWLLLGLPCYIIGHNIAKWLRRRNWYEVHHINARTDTLEKHYVPPETWHSKTVDGPDPYSINEGTAWAVQEYEYLEDVDELRVKGVWFEGIEDLQLYTSKSMMVDMHGWMLDQIEKLADTRAKWSRGAVQYEYETINAMTEARERGVTIDRDSAQEVFGDITGDGDDDLPGLDVDDMPSIDDYTEGGEPADLDDKIDRAQQHQEAMSDD